MDNQNIWNSDSYASGNVDSKTTTQAFEGYFYKEEPSLLTGLPKLHVVYGKNGCKLQNTAALAFEAYNYRRIFFWVRKL